MGKLEQIGLYKGSMKVREYHVMVWYDFQGA